MTAFLLFMAMASPSPVPGGICLGQAWLIVEKGETVERMKNVPFEGAILKSGPYEYYIQAGPAPKNKRDFGVRYLERTAVYVATPYATYSITSNNRNIGWTKERLRHLRTGEDGRAACRRAARR
jgi:hypothetical protein